ncbi:MAG: hypothetical protein IIW56_12570, partial [Oscillospiraceae bacterium]|nr:hypothetical protein [Oscillospiraceae bacterium]
MNLFQRASRKYSYILWCLLFIVAYIGYAYYITHFILSIAYVKYLTFSMNLVAKGVVSYLLGSFVFFMVCIMIEAGFTAILLSLLRKFLIKRCTLRLDRENIYKFSSVCNILLNFIIAIGFVFLLGIKDNFFEMYYFLFEASLSEESVIVERMAYDVEMNWIFCDVLVFKMLFEALFHKDALHKRFSKPEALPAEEVSEEPT